MHENDVPPNQLNNKLITKNNKNLRLHFLILTTFVNQMTPIIVILRKENKNLQTKGQICKNHENWFYENWLFQEEKICKENKTVRKSELYFNRQMMWIVYRDAKLQFNRNKIGRSQKSISFFIKNKYFQNS